jgi:muramidase (phage lysozyme)
MTNEEKALLDVIAYAEGTLGVSQNGYDLLYGFRTIIGWEPNTTITHQNGGWKYKICEKKDGTAIFTTAAGRYQFTYPTWVGMNDDKNTPLTKRNQDIAGVKLINKKIGGINKKLLKKNKDTDFKKVIDSLKNTWTSFKVKKIDDLHGIYLEALDIYDKKSKKSQ